MRRRGFLTLLGAAAVAPALPVAAPRVAVAAPYSRFAFGQAVFHARTRAHISPAGLVRRLKVSTAQAEAMISEMSARGMVRPILGSGGSVRAVSNILKPDAWGLAQARARTIARMKEAEASRAQGPQLAETWLDHLRQVAVQNGFALGPRAQVAA